MGGSRRGYGEAPESNPVDFNFPIPGMRRAARAAFFLRERACRKIAV
jgi:hypothetical protein